MANTRSPFILFDDIVNLFALMGISILFEDVRKAQERHKVLTYVVHAILSTIMLAGFWVLIRYGVDDDRYFWLGIAMVLIPGFAMLPSWVRHH